MTLDELKSALTPQLSPGITLDIRQDTLWIEASLPWSSDAEPTPVAIGAASVDPPYARVAFSTSLSSDVAIAKAEVACMGRLVDVVEAAATELERRPEQRRARH